MLSLSSELYQQGWAMQMFPMDLPRFIWIIMYEQSRCVHGAEQGSCTCVLNAQGILQPVVKGMPEHEPEMFLNQLKMLSDVPRALIFHIALLATLNRCFSSSLQHPRSLRSSSIRLLLSDSA